MEESYYYFIEPLLLLGLLISAVFAYRSNRSLPFLLLFVSVLLYFFAFAAPYVIWPIALRSATVFSFIRPWWPTISRALHVLFIVVLSASMILFIRRARQLPPHSPNQAMQPTASPRTASLLHD